MGQKTNPRGFRLIRTKRWSSKYFANKNDYGNYVKEDKDIRDFINNLPVKNGLSSIRIERMSGKIKVIIVTARPGQVIGKKGTEADKLKKDLSTLTKKEVWVEVEEVKRPETDARITAVAIAGQLERRISFRRAMKKAMQDARSAGALGIKVQCSGRLGGADIARTEWYKEGSVPLHTMRADIDYSTARAETTYGTIGVKVWIYKNENNLAREEN